MTMYLNDNVFAVFPDLKTPRVDLRQVCMEDLEMVYAFNADLEALRYVARDPYTDLAQAEDKVQIFLNGFAEKQGLWWTFVHRETGQPMGYGGLFGVDSGAGAAELGYGLLKEYWGQGYITEIVDEMVRFGFTEMGLQLIQALVVSGNSASARVLLRQGFNLVGTVTGHSQARGQSFDMGQFEYNSYEYLHKNHFK